MKFTPRPSQCSLQQTLLPVRRWTSSRASGEVNSTSGRRCIDTIGMTSPVAVFVRTHVVVVDSYRTFGMVEDIVRGTAQHGALDFTGPTTTQHDEGRFLVLGKVHQPLVRTVSGGRHERCPHLRKWKQAVTEKNIILRWHKSHDVSNHQQLYCLFNNLFMPTSKKNTSALIH